MINIVKEFLFAHRATRNLVINGDKISQGLDFVRVVEFFQDRLDFLKAGRIKVVSLSSGLADNCASANSH